MMSKTAICHVKHGQPTEIIGGSGGMSTRLDKHVIRDDMVRKLIGIANTPIKTRSEMIRVITAAKAVIDAIDTEIDREERPLASLIKMLGDEQKALDWMREKIPVLESKLGNGPDTKLGATEAPQDESKHESKHEYEAATDDGPGRAEDRDP